MAQLNIGHNELRGKAKKHLLIGIALVFISIITLSILGPNLITILPAAIGSFFLSRFNALRLGIKGEKKTISLLKKLPEGYEGFTSVKVAYDGKSAEIDTLIIGENGVFVVEVKNHNGKIQGSADDSKWTQHKVGRKGGRYTNHFGSPVKQVKRQVWILSNYLKENRVNTWIQGVVYFSNRWTKVQVISNDVPVISAYDGKFDLNDYILHYEPKRKLDNALREKLRNVLIQNIGK